ncbi:hypothetical protein V6Z11_A11G321100 [Gossypium hirsutum]
MLIPRKWNLQDSVRIIRLKRDAISQKQTKSDQIERQIVELGPNHKGGKAKDLTSILTL